MANFRNLKQRQSHLKVAVVLFIAIWSLSFIWDLLFDILDFRLAPLDFDLSHGACPGYVIYNNHPDLFGIEFY